MFCFLFTFYRLNHLQFFHFLSFQVGWVGAGESGHFQSELLRMVEDLTPGEWCRWESPHYMWCRGTHYIASLALFYYFLFTCWIGWIVSKLLRGSLSLFDSCILHKTSQSSWNSAFFVCLTWMHGFSLWWSLGLSKGWNLVTNCQSQNWKCAWQI